MGTTLPIAAVGGWRDGVSRHFFDQTAGNYVIKPARTEGHRHNLDWPAPGQLLAEPRSFHAKGPGRPSYGRQFRIADSLQPSAERPLAPMPGYFTAVVARGPRLNWLTSSARRTRRNSPVSNSTVKLLALA